MTTKKDIKNHGYGIIRIQEIVKKYNGSVDFKVEEDIFQISIILTEK